MFKRRVYTLLTIARRHPPGGRRHPVLTAAAAEPCVQGWRVQPDQEVIPMNAYVGAQLFARVSGGREIATASTNNSRDDSRIAFRLCNGESDLLTIHEAEQVIVLLQTAIGLRKLAGGA